MNFPTAGAGKGSPTMGHFSYHNPALTASPYSTLPRRPGAKTIGGRNALQDNNGLTINSVTHGPVSYSSDKHSPLMLELGSINFVYCNKKYFVTISHLRRTQAIGSLHLQFIWEILILLECTARRNTGMNSF